MSNNSRTKNFMYNSFTTAIYQMVVMIVGFITPKIMLQVYGSEVNGLVSSITQFISYFNLVEAGLAGAAVYSLYKPLAEKDYEGINGIVSATNKFYIQSGYIFTALVIGLSVLYPCFVKSEELSPIMIGILVLVLGAKGFLEFFTLAKYRALLTADQKTYIISIASTIYTILNMIIILILSLLKFNIVIVYTFAIISVFVRTLLLIVYCKKHYKFLNYNAKPNKKALNQRWDALFSQISGSVQVGAPTVLATIFTSLKTVSVYSIYNMVMTGVNGVLGIFVSGLSASFGDVIAKKQTSILQRAYKEFEYIYSSLLVVVYSTSMVMIVPFVKLYTHNVTDINYDRPLIGILFVLSSLLYNLKTPQGMVIIAAGLYKETRVQYILQALIVIVAGVVLAPLLGLSGIILAGCLASLYRCIDVLFFVPKHITKLPITSSLFVWIRVLVMMIIIVIPFYFLKIDINSIIEWIIMALVVIVFSVIIVCIFGFIFNRGELKGLINRIKNLRGSN